MSKELIVSLNGREKKIAIIEDDVVTEFYVERGDENQGIVGNIYKGKVMKVLPGMQSAFVDIGLERDAFLYVSDFLDDEEFEGAFQDDRKEEKKPQRPERPEKYSTSRRVVTTITPATEAEEDEDEDEDDEAATLEALSHIEEIGEEPIIEHDEEDEAEAAVKYVIPTKKDEEKVDSTEQRRHRRLTYVRPREEPVVAAAVVAEIPVVETVEPVVAEAAEEVQSEVQDDQQGRRRRRPRGKKNPRLELEAEELFVEPLAETEPAAVEEPAPVEISAAVEKAPSTPQIFEPTPLSEPGEPMERVNDDDLAPTVSAKAAARREQLVLEKLEVEPTPEIRVGALQTALQSNSDFERVSDDEAEPEPVKVESRRKSKAEPVVVADPVEAVDSVESETDVTDETASAESVELTDEIAPITDAKASVRGKKTRAEFATRRGGRGRRRRPANDETLSPEETETKEVKPLESEAKEPQERQPENGFSSRSAAAPRSARPVISDLLREGQEVLVQIAKEPIGQKGARITSHVVLPGRYVVYMPTVEHIGVSRKIGTDEERLRLKRTLNQLRAENNIPGGFIVRTAAGGRTIEELRDDVGYLARTWSEMRRRSDRSKAPSVVHRDLDLVQRILRDQLSSDFTAIRVDSEFEYERIVDFVNRFAPKLIHRVKLYTKETSILDEYGVQAEIDKAVKPRVWLKSGGYIVINQTEALVAIDVNTGKFVGRSNRLEDTIVKTNLEAAKEIARQIRLRDLGGIIILDFIDMEERRNKQRVYQALEQELRHDKSPSKILQFNDFGLVAITRKRVKQSLERTLCTPCAYCGGGGMVKSPQTICYELLAEVRRIAKHEENPGEVILRVNPEVAKALRTTEQEIFVDIESHFNGVVTIKSDPAVHQEQFDIALL